MSYTDKDRQAWEWLMNPGAAPDEGIDLDRLAGELNMSSYDGEVTPPPANPHTRTDAVVTEAAREVAKELAARKRAAAEQAAKDALAAGASREQAQHAAREAGSALDAEASAKATEYAAAHPEQVPAPPAQPAAPAAPAAPTSDEDELAAFNAAMTGTAPAPADAVPAPGDDQEATAPALGDNWEAQAAERAHQEGLAADYSGLPSIVQPLVTSMIDARVNPADHQDLLETAARVASAGMLGTLSEADITAAHAVNKHLTDLGLPEYFT